MRIVHLTEPGEKEEERREHRDRIPSTPREVQRQREPGEGKRQLLRRFEPRQLRQVLPGDGADAWIGERVMSHGLSAAEATMGSKDAKGLASLSSNRRENGWIRYRELRSRVRRLSRF